MKDKLFEQIANPKKLMILKERFCSTLFECDIDLNKLPSVLEFLNLSYREKLNGLNEEKEAK